RSRAERQAKKAPESGAKYSRGTAILHQHLPGTHVRDADGVVLHVGLVAEQAAQVELNRLARCDIRGTGRPALLGLQNLAVGVLGFDLHLRGGGLGTVIDQLAAEAQTNALAGASSL